MRPSKTPTKGVLRDEILVVDDVADNRLLLRALLEQDRYTIREAQDGLEALAMIAAREPDLVLLDVMMPRMDGFEVLSRLRASDARDVPVMLLTAAASEPEAVERGIALGAIEYVKKPIDGAELRARVRGVLRVEKLRRDMAALRRDHEAMMVHDLRHPVCKLSLIGRKRSTLTSA
jgi:CheY-like chemotaxis protein